MATLSHETRYSIASGSKIGYERISNGNEGQSTQSFRYWSKSKKKNVKRYVALQGQRVDRDQYHQIDYFRLTTAFAVKANTPINHDIR